jgi:carbonic anhydrase/acetyltransferase-like protein (isoleucine patch superfamily)
MLIDPLVLAICLLFAGIGFVVLILSPLIMELKRPKDRGPRKMVRTPLERRIRRSVKKPAAVGSDSAEDVDSTQDLEALLHEAGVRTARIGKDTVRIFGDVLFLPRLKVLDNIVVEGTLDLSHQCVLNQSAKVKGQVSVGNRVVIKGNLVSEGDVNILDEAVVGGSVHSEGSVKIGENVFIASSVVATGDVELYENSEVAKNILTRGVIRVLPRTRVDLPSDIDKIG